MADHGTPGREDHGQPVWTVDTWRVRPGREVHFLDHCRTLNPDPLILYRDTEEPGLFWSPAKWESREALERWWAGPEYLAAIRSLEEDLLDHQTHVMTDVPGFPPHASSNEDSPGP
jgi:Antibiotic biosynthesis monooxygenase